MAYDGLSGRTQRIEEWPETGGDDPTDEGRDRLMVHAVWEGLLAVIVVAGTALVYRITPDTLAGTGLQVFLLFAAALGITAIGAGWSLRAAVPNLAVGPIALAAAVFFGQQSEGGFWYGVVVTLAAATALGVLLGLVVVGLGVPAWAGSLAAVLFLGSWLASAGWVDLPNAIRYDPADHSLYWFLGFVAASVLGGLLWALAPVRRTMGAYRLMGDPAVRAGFAPSMAGLAALVGSSVLASTGGVLLALMGRGSTADLGIGWTGLAFGAVLLGGTSVYGRIGGVFGTLLAVVLLALGVRFAKETGSDFPMIGHAGVAVLVGLLITRLVERFGQPGPDVEDEESEWDDDEPVRWTPPPNVAPGWSGELPKGGGGRRPMALPARPAEPGALPSRSGGPTEADGGSPPDRGGISGGIGDRANRLRHPGAALPSGVLSGDVVPGDRSTRPGFDGFGDSSAPRRNRIWDTDAGGTGSGNPAAPFRA